MKTKKVHRVLEFNQSKWLKQYITLYAQKRIEPEKEWSSKPSFVTQEIFENDLVAIHKIKTTSTLTKPLDVGMHGLELSKVPIYEFNYN